VHRRFLGWVGYGPRTLARVLRLQRAVVLLRSGRPAAEVAVEAGYADQPHLSREMRALTGRTPRELAPAGPAPA
jgi:AraC-like DNA-binding protein